MPAVAPADHSQCISSVSAGDALGFFLCVSKSLRRGILPVQPQLMNTVQSGSHDAFGKLVTASVTNSFDKITDMLSSKANT